MPSGHETDPIGARDVDSEAQGRLIQGRKRDTSPGTKHSPIPRGPSQSTIIQDMLKTVERFVNITIDRPERSTFVPCAHMMYTILYYMDEIMSMNRYWSSRYVRWNPILSRLYYGILFYIQTIRVQCEYSIATPALRRLLRDFEDEFDYAQLAIAGPLLPIFKAICASPPEKGNYGVIVPRIPDLPGATDATSHALSEEIRVLLPNISGLRRAANRVMERVGNVVPNWDAYMHNSHAAQPAPPSHNAGNEQSRDARVMPGCVHPMPWNTQAWNIWQSQANKPKVPDLAADAGVLTWTQFLGFSQGFEWLSVLAGIMADHAKFWKGRGTMEQLVLYDSNHNQIVVHGLHEYANRDDHRDGDQIMKHEAKTTSKAQNVDELATKLAAFTQINFETAPNFDPTLDRGGRIGQTRFGPFWDQDPDESNSIQYDPSIALPSILATVHLERPEKVNQ